MAQEESDPDATVPITDAAFGVRLEAGQRVFNRFVLEREIARGGMGIVWRAKDNLLKGKTIALKFLPAAVACDEVAKEELIAETIEAQKLSHKNIVRVVDFHNNDEKDATMVAISMEFVDGTTLDSLRLRQPRKVFSVEILGQLVRQICSALDYAHTEAKVVHRDLKPANILVRKPADKVVPSGPNAANVLVPPEYIVKIIDLGIARSLNEAQIRFTGVITLPNRGTHHYMSPQRLRNEKPAAADDIYAIGAILYELLTTKPPYSECNGGTLQMQAMQDEPISSMEQPSIDLPSMAQQRIKLCVAGDPIPAEWEKAAKACLSRQAERRPSARELLTMLGLGDVSMPPQDVKAPAAGGASSDDTVPIPRPLDLPKPPGTPAKRRQFWVVLSIVIPTAAFAVIFWFKSKDPVANPPAPTPSPVSSYKTKVKDSNNKAQDTSVHRQGRPHVENAAIQLPEVKSGAVKLHITNPGIASAQVKVEVDGKERDLEGGDTIPGLDVGAHSVVVIHPDYVLWKKNVTVSNQPPSPISVTLEPKPGRITVDAEPSDVLLTVNGREVGPDQLKNGVLMLPADQTFKVVAKTTRVDYHTATKTFKLPANGSESWTFKLEPVHLKENTLGMKFVPVPGTDVYFSIWDTRVQDFAAFISRTSYEATGGMLSRDASGNYGAHGASWRDPGFAQKQTDTDPVVGVSWVDARKFCAWLTKTERDAGHLTNKQEYRLPKDAEWSAAVGLKEPPGGTPQVKDKKIEGVYPWGTQRTPPRRAGNYADDSAKRSQANQSTINGYDDGFADTSPVLSFLPNKYGLYDMGGNVWQWCEESPNGNSGDDEHVLRGASFREYEDKQVFSSARKYAGKDVRNDHFGFRCVLAPVSTR